MDAWKANWQRKGLFYKFEHHKDLVGHQVLIVLSVSNCP
jgi:hypothetical protein